MEENVALDSAKQKKFDKSIKGIKKLIKKKDAESKEKGDQADKVKAGRVGKRKRPQRGLVYLSHIPHGFYENEMSQYFKQFGVVTNARVIKSKRTGRSKGYAFVEFKEPAVAQIVAETMNNYLMGKRLIKAAYIPPEKQKRKVFRKHWNTINNPGNILRIKMKKAHNANKDEAGELKRARQLLTNLNKTKKKLRDLGVNYDFFTPVDVPEALIERVESLQKTEEVKVKNADSKENVLDIKKEQIKNAKNKSEKSKKLQAVEVDKNIQKQKKQNLKDKGVTPMEDFIKVKDEESDSSLEFDSDEYEKMLEDSDVDSDSLGDESDEVGSGSDENSDDVSSDEDDSDAPPSPKKITKVAGKKVAQKKQPQPLQTKRNAPKKSPVAPTSKKPKFEKKSNQKPVNKQFKKKK
ncbi:RNA recognition motif domain-containing protein [Phthorimaea operculella]|nr:RNA recognition motif domain-containing protein [Phthorimaea operculella]